MVDGKILDAFHLMWGKFPEPVMLLHKSRKILAINDVAQAAGIPIGVKCSSLNPENKTDGHCRSCEALAALSEGSAKVCSDISTRRIKGYWLPLKGVEDIYIHFGISIGDEIDAVLVAAGKNCKSE